MIRPFRITDRARLIDICQRTSAFDAADQAIILELADIYLNDPVQKDYYCAAAVDEQDQLTGFVCYGPTPLTEGTFDLYWVVVDPDMAKRGIGKTLLGYMEQRIMASGGRLIVIETSSTLPYEAARCLYEHNGYSLPEVVKDFYRPGEDRLTYTKLLANHQ